MTGESSYSSRTTANSPFSSGLTTPNDEEPHHSLFSPVVEDQTPKQVGGFEVQQPFQKYARKRPLFRVMSRAREAAKSVFETPKRLKKVWWTQSLPIVVSDCQVASVSCHAGRCHESGRAQAGVRSSKRYGPFKVRSPALLPRTENCWIFFTVLIQD